MSSPANERIVFRNVHFSYIGGELLFIDKKHASQIDKPIYIEGSIVGFDRCLFAGAQNTALFLRGAKLVVKNSVFIENNHDGNFESRPILLRPKGTYRINYNTFINNCSDAMEIIPDGKEYVETTRPEIAYNHICNAGLYNSDVSGVYLPFGN